MSYISKIREKIGHELLIYLGAGVIVYSDEKILLQKRKDNGTWALHAGGIEVGEELEETARRELFEETGLKAGKLELLGIYSGQDRFRVEFYSEQRQPVTGSAAFTNNGGVFGDVCYAYRFTDGSCAVPLSLSW